MTLLVLDRAEVERRTDLDAVRAAVRRSLVALAGGRATLPGVLHFDLGRERGDLHVKGAWLHEEETFTIKVAGAFPGAAAHGLPTAQGLSVVFDAVTGAPLALLDDGGWLTDVRTAAAGAIAVDALAPAHVEHLAVLGAGGQARHQIDAILGVRRPDRLTIGGRRPGPPRALAEWASERHGIPCAATDIADAVRGAGVVVTATSARSPLFDADLVTGPTLVVAVGADTPGKQELDPRLLQRADLLVADDVRQCAEQGELQHLGEPAPDVHTLGALLARGDAEQIEPPAWTLAVVDLTGVGVQDAAVASLVLAAARA